jgi:hypothetical protein
MKPATKRKAKAGGWPPLAVGDTIYFVTTLDRSGRRTDGDAGEVLTVESVGTKWAVCNVPGRAYGAEKVNARTLEAAPNKLGMVVARAFRSEADWREDRARAKAWEAVRSFVAGRFYRPPEHLSSAELREIFVKLGGNP